MSVAKCLGVDNLDASNTREAAAEWPRWQEAEPTLDVVDDVHDLPCWMKRADPANRDSVLAALLRVAETDGRATLVLGWLLVPGASLLAGRLHRLADVIDEVVAGQLWIQICEHDPTDATYVAKNILSRVERETMAELGMGDLARRRDPAWAAPAVLLEPQVHLFSCALEERATRVWLSPRRARQHVKPDLLRKPCGIFRAPSTMTHFERCEAARSLGVGIDHIPAIELLRRLGVRRDLSGLRGRDSIR